MEIQDKKRQSKLIDVQEIAELRPYDRTPKYILRKRIMERQGVNSQKPLFCYVLSEKDLSIDDFVPG